MPEVERLDEDEMVDILEDLARNSRSATARIQAIKTLREIHGQTSEPQQSVFEGLYEVSNPQRSRRPA